MRRAPLWLRLVAGVLALVSATLLITGFAGTRLLRHYLMAQTEKRLVATAERVRHFPRTSTSTSRPSGRQELPSDYVVQSYAADGTLTLTLDSGDQAPPKVRPGPLDRPYVDGDWLVVRVDQREGGYLAVGTRLTGVDDTVDRLATINLGVAAVALLALGVACWGLARTLGRIEAALLSREASEQAAVSAAEQMRRFVGEASHELRTPVTTIRGYADVFRQQRASLELADADRIIDRISAQAVRMSGLVDDLLLLAQLDQHRPLAAERVDLLDVAADVVLDDLTDRVTLTGESSSVVGDPVRLRQAVGNLVDNALRHTAGPVSVVVGPGVVDVVDEGPGIPAEHADRIFERFYRVGSTRAAASSGAGLGLAIVAAIAAAHGGAVALEASDSGAHFRLTLPGA
ncbi:putative sensor histidine kinase PhoR [Longispora fulva]|uniref:histidine kinase n=1 Tax=Longispora fulva TaxID=619741 RepID=A0A8J7KYB4_9ACTN|nr:ATP-binding protein [Longispora fulva]MBG6139112.1 two-component system OmpR family sensor kinase [Longispora fulva]GIG58604.1 putative sensor histidine kinase PhoR [Longispora fulva]